jgi:uncharacterized SAM-binding protein YcdF (DUF218 family)
MARKPIIISGGAAVPSGIPESEIGKRFLTKLGIRSDRIMIETRSRDTHENASYTKELCAGKGVAEESIARGTEKPRKEKVHLSRG